MKLLILTEGGSRSGFGHLTRTSAIGNAIRKLSPQSRVNFCVIGDIKAKVYAKKLGFNIHIENWIKKWSKWKKMAESADAVLIDTYKTTLAVCEKIASVNSRCFWLDDYGRLLYPAGTVITPAPYVMPGKKRLSKLVKTFSGKEFVILRSAFQKDKGRCNIRKNIKNVVILLGGTGTGRPVRKVIKELTTQNRNLKFSWVAPHDAVSPKISNLRVFKNISAEKLITLIRKSDVAISAAGQTLYELAALGLPTIAVQIAKNQRHNILALKKTGFLQSAGFKFTPATLRKVGSIFRNLKSPTVRRLRGQKGLKSVTYKGAERIATLIMRGKA